MRRMPASVLVMSPTRSISASQQGSQSFRLRMCVNAAPQAWQDWTLFRRFGASRLLNTAAHLREQKFRPALLRRRALPDLETGVRQFAQGTVIVSFSAA